MPIYKEDNKQAEYSFSASIVRGELCSFCSNDAMDYIAKQGPGLGSIKWACPHRQTEAVIRIETITEF